MSLVVHPCVNQEASESKEMINTTCSGKSRMDTQTYRATYRARVQSPVKKDAKKRSNDVLQDSENDFHAMGSEPSYKRQRVGSATEASQHYSCSSDGVMTHGQKSSSIPKDVHNQELEKDLSMAGPPVDKEDKVGSKESVVEASHDQSPLALQDSSKSPSADSNNSKFVEYWVPVQLTDIQLEQYCSTLMKNTELLCSSKKQSFDLLHDVLGALRNCCDHPYVLDSSLQKFCKERCPLADYLSLGIQASGKLQLLNKFLLNIREKGLRVLIVYKTTSRSMKNDIGIGDILDDFICQSFGQESYVHIYSQRYVPPKEKQAAVDLFNDRKSGRFVVLTEYCSPPVSIRLTSLDIVILFNSDLYPITDIRSLQKTSLHTDNGQLKVLRLYSLCTLEEKALRMASDGVVAPTVRQLITKSTCQKLLNWGATSLFDRLDTIHSSSSSESNKSVEDDFLCNVLHELSTILSSNVGCSSTSCSVISKVKEVGEGCYENIELYGELQVQSLDDVPPHVIWSSLLRERIPCWRNLPNEAGSMKKRISFWERPPEISDGLLYEEIPNWHRDTNHYAKRSKRVKVCVSRFQEKLQEMKTLWYSEISEQFKKVDKPLKKRRLEKKNVEEHVEKELLITELCGESYRKLGRFKLHDEIQFGRICNDVDKCWEDLYPPQLTARNSEEEIDAPSSTSIESRNLITFESAIGTLEEQPVENMDVGEELNTENGNNLPTEISSTFRALEEVTLKNDQPISVDHVLNGSGQFTSDWVVLEEDLDIFAECLPLNEMSGAIGSDSGNIYVRPKTVPVAEISDPIPSENLVACDSASSLSESELGASISNKDQNHVSKELTIQSETVEDIPDTMCEEILHGNEKIPLQQSVAIGSDSDDIYVRPKTVPVAELSDPIPPENLVACDSASSLSKSELGASISNKDQNHASKELTIQSETVEDIPDTMCEEILHGNEKIPLQQSVDQIHQLPSEQLPPPPSPCSGIRVPSESAQSSPSCEIVENEASSRPIQSPTGDSMRPNTPGPLDSFLMQIENELMMHSDDDPTPDSNRNNNLDLNLNTHQPSTLDPFQGELERIKNTEIMETKKLGDKVMQLKASRDKEIEQICQKYGLLYQNAQKDFAQKKQELKICYEKTKAHKALAESWKLATDENILIPPPPLVQNTFTLTNIQPPYQTMLPLPYPLSYQNLCNSGVGYGHYTQNPYRYPSFPTQTSHLHGYPQSRPNQYPAVAYPQLYSQVEYLPYYNIPI